MNGRGAGAEPGDRGPSPWWPAAALAAVAGATALTDQYTRVGLRQILAWACAASAVLALGWAVTLARQLRAERARSARDRRTARARAAEVTRLATVRLPAIAELRRAGKRLDSAPGPLAPAADTGDEFARALETVVTALGSDEAVRRERVLRDSVQAAFESVARNMHAMATVQQQVLDRVERTIEDPRLMAEVMKADHAAAQMTRKAQTLLVMCGIWPARRETQPVSLYDCVRGAQSRIVEFNRIEVHGGQTLYAVPPVVEGLMHAIAELLENATVFSPSRTQVVVTVREVGAGAVVEIDDAGLGMPADVLRQSTARLRDELDLAELGAVPRLGLACVGRWTRELGFSVELTGTSAYGGTRAVAFVPYRLLTEPLSHFSGSGRRRSELPGRAARKRAAPGGDGPGYAYEDAGSGSGAHRLTADRSGTAQGPAQGPARGRDGARRDTPVTVSGGRRDGGGGRDPGAYAEGYRGTPAPPEAYSDAPQHSLADQDQDRNQDRNQKHDQKHDQRQEAETGAADRQGAAQHHPARPPGGAAPGALPRRRSRRGAAVEAAAQTALTPQPPAAPQLPADRPAWTPEAARASVASVVSGSRRGRAAVAHDTPDPDRVPHTDHTDAHHGGRP
ncbi:ATP-binding protein [Streptomyces inusitatus]|uniref:ATP-binding protein n=1 Tax=Streptomyces inusitatus TaxID=68221 RepID=UPI001E4701AA|nr:ATP-binding protein [Streptomyces inusitatus]